MVSANPLPPTLLPGAGDDTQMLSVVGDGVCKVFRIEAGNSLKPLPSALAKREGQAYTCHAWLIDNDARESLVSAHPVAGGGQSLVGVRGTRAGVGRPISSPPQMNGKLVP